MARLKALTMASAAVFALASSAFAADLLPPPPALEPAPPVADFSGWYLRGDIGMAVNASSLGLRNSPEPINGNGYLGAGATESFNNTSLSSSEVFDVGVGYQFNRWLRGDLTVEYRDGGHLQSTYGISNPNFATSGSSVDSQFVDFYRGNTSSLIGLANAYADIGTWYGVTPFIGGGIGVAHNTVYGMTDQGLVINGATGVAGSSGGYFGNGSSNQFAWALMAGLDFDVTANLKLELGYRYLSYGKITSGGSNCINGTGFGNADCNGAVANYVSSTDRLASNDFKVGLIYMLGEPEAPPPPALPLVRKY